MARVRAALNGDKVDRPPYSFWTHLPGIDLDPARLAAATAAFQARHDLDFVKSMPNGLYCVEDWGAKADFGAIERGGTAAVVEAAITRIEDWDALAMLDVTKGAYGRELAHLDALVRQVGPDVPVLATVFSPLTIAAKLSQGAHKRHLAEDQRSVARGLDVITEVTCAFLSACRARGCAGMFFATQDATVRSFSAADYRRFGKTYDDRVLEVARQRGAWFNVLHAHGDDILFDVLREYEITALNWHIGETPPSIAAYRASGGTRPIVGGLQRAHLTRRDRSAIAADIRRAVDESGGRGILLAPACVIRHPVDDETLAWAADSIRALAG